MSVAPIIEWAGSSAAVETDDGALRRDAVRSLAAAGIEVDARADLIVLLLTCGASARVDRMRTTVRRHPAARVVASMPTDARGSALRRALHAGVHGVVLDDQIPSVLVPTVQAVLAGQVVVPPALRRQLAPPALSHREKQVLSLVASGYTNRQIADELYVAQSTVKTHLSSAFTKLDARSRAEAAAIVLDREAGLGPALLGPAPDVRRGTARRAEDPSTPAR